ncbi:substrate-binding periplasmic protein [Bacillus sp. 1NLA3E]|uniref:substrate-binding periplasmic protein n=1 Tax=Bacillus sp. 1NLA3E TaxID=666686 RepID=UPI000247ECEC|nr:ABC transporter substrate-binding protein [Bacillus sp. 1NLA3E]AGK53475.1 family 3 extracellular solute-binding protein [Bacillus sp. 1NLA3E]
MKKIVSFIMIVTLISSLLAGCGSSSKTNSSSATAEKKDTLETAKEKGVLVVGASNDAPFAFIDKDTKEFTGIDADIIKEVAKRLGIPKVEMREVKFENLLLELNNHNIDLVTDGMYRKPEREKIVQFTDIWYKQGEALIVPKDSSIKGINDLKDKVVGGQKGVTFLELAQDLEKQGKIGRVDIFGSSADLLLATNTGKIDATMTDGVVAAYSITKDPSLNLKIVTPYKAQATGKIASAARKEDKTLVEAINKELAELKKEGFILKVLKKYGLNEDYYVPTNE